MVGWDGDIAGGNQLIAIVETEHDAALGVDVGDDEGGALDELEFQLRSAGVRAARAVGCVHVFEDDSFAIGGAEFFEDIDLVVGCEGGADPAQGGLPNRDHHHQAGEAIDVAALTEVVALHFQQVEGMEGIAHGFAINEDIERDLLEGFTDRIRDGNDESPAVDAGNGVALLADHESAAVVFFLKAVTVVAQQQGNVGQIDGVEELAANAAVGSFFASLLVGLGIACAGSTVLIALGELRGNELLVGLGGIGKGHRVVGLGAGGQRVATSAISEGNKVTFAAWFNGGVIDFVGIALAIMQRGGLDGGYG